MHSTSSHKHRVCALNSHPNLSQVNNLQDWECLQEYEPSQWHLSCFLLCFLFETTFKLHRSHDRCFSQMVWYHLGASSRAEANNSPGEGSIPGIHRWILCFTSVRTDRRHLGSPYRRCNSHRSQHARLFHRASTTCRVSDWAFYTGVNLHKFHSVMNWGSLCIALQLQRC